MNGNSQLKYLLMDFWTVNGDPHSSQYLFLTSGPFNFLFIIASYLYFVKVLGPKFMKTRPPFELTAIIRYYNLAMAAYNLWFFYNTLIISNWGIDTWKCANHNSNSDEIHKRTVFLGWTLLISRLVELMDTIFFVMRKNFHQASTLHLFHHTVVPLLVWFPLKLGPSIHYGFPPLINSLVHTIMYTYYWLSTFGPEVRAYLWWKKYLTRLQLIQFVVIIVNCSRVFFIPDCQLSQTLMLSLVFIALILFFLFTSFYLNTYGRKVPKIIVSHNNNIVHINGYYSSRKSI